MHRAELERQIPLLATLDDPVRRAIYLHVVGQPGEVSRDQAARAAKVMRGLAAYHLDHLVRAGLLEATYRRLSGRQGPGAGRPSKLYRRSTHQFELSLPQRRYGMAARLLAQGIEKSGSESTLKALRQSAYDLGVTLGVEARRRAGPHPGREDLLRRAQALLDHYGFEPSRNGETIRLRNCPFDALAAEFRDLVCGMNLSLMEGFLSGLRAAGVRAELDRQPGMCCAVFRLTRPS